MWHAKTWAVDPNPTVTFTLGGAFDLKGIHSWNGNQALNLAHIRRGVNSFELSVSKDGGTSYALLGTYNLTVSPLPGTQISAQSFDLTGQDGVTHVKMRVLSTHNSPGGGGDYASLSEVMLTAFLVPDVLKLTRFEVGDGKVTLAWPSVVSWTGNTVTLAEDLASDLSWSGGYKIQTPVEPETVWIDTAPPAGKAFYKVN